MTIEGKNLIKKYEGCKLSAYKCPAGVWTIGYGHTKNVKPGMVITQQEADKFFDDDIATFESGVKKYVLGISLNNYQIDALISFAYNLGLGSLGKSTLLKKVKANPNDQTIRDEFMKWVNAGGKKLEGLVRRRKEEADLYFK